MGNGLKTKHLGSWSLSPKSMIKNYIVEIEFAKIKLDHNFYYSWGLNSKMIGLGNSKYITYILILPYISFEAFFVLHRIIHISIITSKKAIQLKILNLQMFHIFS